LFSLSSWDGITFAFCLYYSSYSQLGCCRSLNTCFFFQTKRKPNILFLITRHSLHKSNTSILIMHFSTTFIVLLSFTSALAVPIQLSKKATAAGVLKVQTYDEFNISGGVAGNALAEVAAAFPVSSSPCLPSSTNTLRSTRPTSPALRPLI